MDKRRRRILRKNMVLGGFLFVCVAVLTVLTFRLSGITFHARRDWVVYFGRNSIIRHGYEVQCSGTKVGLVKSVTLLPPGEIAPDRHVRAVITLDAGLVLWEGAEVVVRARGLLGGFMVDLDRGDPSRPPLPEGSVLPGRVESGVTDQLNRLIQENREVLGRITRDLAEVAARLRRGEGSLGKLISDAELYENLRTASAVLARAAAQLDAPDSTLGRLLREPRIYEDLAATTGNLRALSEELRTGKGPLAVLLRDEKLAADLQAAARGLGAVAGRLERGEGTLGRLLTDDRLHEELLAGVAALRRFAEHVERGGGTLSRLMTDPEVYENLRVLSGNLRAISEDLRAGKGTAGLLLRDESVYRELRRMLESFRESGEIARENAPLSSLASFSSLFFNVFN